MKKLFVVRHAKSSWDFPNLDDLDRPLNKRGKKNVPEMGKRLASKKLKVDLMVTSPARRAAHTALIVADQLSFPENLIVEEPMLYHANVRELMTALRTTRNEVMTLMIFGHNPGLTDFVNHLTGSDIYNIPTCGIAEISFNVASWVQIDERVGVLNSLDYPKKSHQNP